jgi:hypothetical protein
MIFFFLLTDHFYILFRDIYIFHWINLFVFFRQKMICRMRRENKNLLTTCRFVRIPAVFTRQSSFLFLVLYCCRLRALIIEKKKRNQFHIAPDILFFLFQHYFNRIFYSASSSLDNTWKIEDIVMYVGLIISQNDDTNWLPCDFFHHHLDWSIKLKKKKKPSSNSINPASEFSQIKLNCFDDERIN